MNARTLSPRKLDIGAFIESGEALRGALTLTDLPRLAQGLSAETSPASLPPVDWSAQGRLVPQRGGEPQRWLDLQAQAQLTFECQRCLGPVTLPVAFTRAIRFAIDEQAAAALDADSEDDVLALARHFDLIALIEDELIMASPIVPRHDACPAEVSRLMQDVREALPPGASSHMAGAAAQNQAEHGANEGEADQGGGRPHPFAALAALKKDRK